MLTDDTDTEPAPQPDEEIVAKLDMIYRAVMNLSDEVQRQGFRQRQEASEYRELLADLQRRVGVIEEGPRPANGHG